MQNQRGLTIPEKLAKLIIKTKNAKTCGLCVRRWFRNDGYATGRRLASGDNDIHGQKNPHERWYTPSA
jgi:hypothetical protein